MKFNALFSTLLFVMLGNLTVEAQINALTESGDPVVLYADGTWTYTDQVDTTVTEIPLNEGVFAKAESSSFMVKSVKTNAGVWIDPAQWTFNKGAINAQAEFEFKYKEGDLYAMFITEETEIPVENLADIALNQAKSVAPDLKLINKEYRIVNGKKVIHMEMHGTIQGIKFAYYGYYYSNSGGSYQLITYTSQALLSEYSPIAEKFLSGFMEKE